MLCYILLRPCFFMGYCFLFSFFFPLEKSKKAHFFCTWRKKLIFFTRLPSWNSRSLVTCDWVTSDVCSTVECRPLKGILEPFSHMYVLPNKPEHSWQIMYSNKFQKIRIFIQRILTKEKIGNLWHLPFILLMIFFYLNLALKVSC